MLANWFFSIFKACLQVQVVQGFLSVLLEAQQACSGFLFGENALAQLWQQQAPLDIIKASK
jgi:hypothetical protein